MAATIIKPYPTDVERNDRGEGRDPTSAVVEVSFSDIRQDYDKMRQDCDRIYKIDRI